MPIPELTEKNIHDALKYIDEKGVPSRFESNVYDLIAENNKKYPIKYVLKIAERLAHGKELNSNNYTSVESKRFLQKMGFHIEIKQVKYELTITAESMKSTDRRFTPENISLGDNYKPIDAYFTRKDGEIIKRLPEKGERSISNQTLPRLSFQIFKNQISDLSPEEKENFPICQYTPDSDVIRGIFKNEREFRNYRNTREFLTFNYENGHKFVIYSWNIFTTIMFVQECLKRFGSEGDSFTLIYREKEEKEDIPYEYSGSSEDERGSYHRDYLNPFSKLLIESKNIILRGAPGTGKSFLAKRIAADIISNGYLDDYTLLNDDQKKQVEFVQFHPNYDYSDFVEGLRPVMNEDGSIGFELQDGIFKRFISRAVKNYENSGKSIEVVTKEYNAREAFNEFLNNIDLDTHAFKTVNGNAFYITGIDEKKIMVSIPANLTVNKLRINIDEILKMLESGRTFNKIKDMNDFFGKINATQEFSYVFAIYKEILKKKKKTPSRNLKQEELKKYVFIIDEINRGEISKIFGELFFAIDPGYRGKSGEVSTQFSNMHADPDEKLYIPENVYIIGTMNDIDRSVDSFDFAMRKRFRFIELKADEQVEMLSLLEDENFRNEVIKRMACLNREIAKVDELNENYQIGASYFLKLREITLDMLWTDYLRPLLKEYVNGMYEENCIMERFANAFGYGIPSGEFNDEGIED